MSCLSRQCVFPVVLQSSPSAPSHACLKAVMSGYSNPRRAPGWQFFFFPFEERIGRGELLFPVVSIAAWGKKRNDQVLHSSLQFMLEQAQHYRASGASWLLFLKIPRPLGMAGMSCIAASCVSATPGEAWSWESGSRFYFCSLPA